MDKQKEFEQLANEAKVAMNQPQKLTVIAENQAEIIKRLDTLILKKDIQIAQQNKFQKAWRATKTTALCVLAFSVLAGLVDPRQDTGIIIDRALHLYSSYSEG